MNWVLLHGFVGSSADFDPLREHLGEVGRVEAPDWPGHGSRSALRSPEDYTLEAHLGIIDAATRDLRGPVTLVGYSLGGRILQHWLADRRPTLPAGSRIALVSTSPGIDDPAERTERRAGDAAVCRLLREDGIGRFLHYWHSQTMFHPLMRMPPDRLAPILARRRACDPEGLALSLEGVGAGSIGPTWDAFGELGAPVSLVVGARDARYAELAQSMRERMPAGSIHVVADAGHALHLERPVELASALTA